MGEGDDGLRRLTDLVATLRGPDGCPWDREQRLEDLRAYLLEEAHELAAAIDLEEPAALAEELGDLVFLIAFVGRLAEEAGSFTLDEVVRAAEAKIVSRHPHVFGGERLEDATAVRRAWEERKVRQRPASESMLAGVPDSLPSLVGAYRLTQKAAGVGFDWTHPEAVLDKILEEADELRELLGGASEPDPSRLKEEVGDLLFTAANLGRKLGIDPEAATAAANGKFRRRFQAIERGLAEDGRTVADASLEEMEILWQQAKASAGRRRSDREDS